MYWLACFIVPIIMLCVIAKATNVYPFGEQSFLSGDLKYQYSDFYLWFKRVLAGQESLFYSTATGLGLNTWGLYSYYLASPFNLLILLFKENQVTLFVFVTTAIKLGCMQITCVLYLKRRFRLSGLIAFLLALGYTWSLWVATDIRNPMWLDSLILLPLIMLYTWQVVERDRWVPLAILVAINIVVCWYTAYMCVIFTIMLAILEWACMRKRYSFFRLAIRFARPFAVSLLLSAWTLIPTVLAMMSSGSEATGFFESIEKIFASESITDLKKAILTTRPIVEVIGRGLIPALYKLDYIPQLYGGLLFITCFILFFLTNVISKRVKRITAIFAIVFFISIFLNPLEAIWCGFRRPNGFFSRPCMFVAPLLLWISAYFIDSCTSKTGSITLPKFKRNINLRRILNSNTRSIQALLALVVVADLTLSGCFGWRAIYQDFTQAENDEYYSQSNEQVSWLKEQDSSIWRMERTYTRDGVAALNESLGVGYIGLSSYSSTHNKSALNLLNTLGYGSSGRMHARYATPILATDSLLGLKYSSSYSRPAGLEEVKGAPTVNGAEIYVNERALSLGYVVSNAAQNAILEGENPFQRQNSFVSSLVGKDVELYRRADFELVESLEEEKSWSAVIPEGTLGYFYVDGVDDEIAAYISIDGSPYYRTGWRFNDSITSLDTTGSGLAQTHSARITMTDPNITDGELEPWQKSQELIDHARALFENVTCEFYYLDLTVLDVVLDELSQNQVTFNQFSGKGIVGNISSSTNAFAIVTIPREAGWSVVVNGKKVEAASAFDGALTLVPIESGDNVIEMHFTSPGLILGLIISAVSVSAVILYCLHRRKKQKNLNALIYTSVKKSD